MNLVIYKHYENADKAKDNINENGINGDETIAYASGKEDIMTVLKELIKTAYA